MTKRADGVAVGEDLHKSAAEYALKKALEEDSKAGIDADDERLKLAIKNFFDSYDSYLDNKVASN